MPRSGQPLLHVSRVAPQWPTPDQIFGANLRDYWDAADATDIVSGRVNSLDGHLTGLTLTKHSTLGLLHQASAPLLNGHPAMEIALGQTLRNMTVPAGWIAAGSRPCMWSIGYFRSTDTYARYIARLATSGWSVRIGFVSSGFATYLQAGSNYYAISTTTPEVNVPYVITWQVMNSALNLWVNGTVLKSAVASNTALPADLTEVYFGDWTSPAQFTCAQSGVTFDTPTDEQLAALYAYAQAKYGVP